MSFKHMSLVINHSKAKGPAKTILLVQAYRANDRGECWPSLGRIATDSGFNRRTVLRCLLALQRIGELLIVRRGHAAQTRGGIQASNRYRITIEPPQGRDGESLPLPDKVGTESPEGRDTQSHKVGTHSPKGRDAQSPESSEKSQYEPSENRQGEKPADLPDYFKIDYRNAEIPEIQDYGDIHGCPDPILAAMAITGERSKRGWGHWVKILNHGRKEHGPERGVRLFRECLTELYGEIKQGECNKPGAVLNMKLKKVFGEQWLNNERKPDHDEP